MFRGETDQVIINFERDNSIRAGLCPNTDLPCDAAVELRRLRQQNLASISQGYSETVAGTASRQEVGREFMERHGQLTEILDAPIDDPNACLGGCAIKASLDESNLN